MLVFVNRKTLQRGSLPPEERASILKHSHFRLDLYTTELRIPIKEVFKEASRLVGRRIETVSGILKMSQCEHDKVERYFKRKYGS